MAAKRVTRKARTTRRRAGSSTRRWDAQQSRVRLADRLAQPLGKDARQPFKNRGFHLSLGITPRGNGLQQSCHRIAIKMQRQEICRVYSCRERRESAITDKTG